MNKVLITGISGFVAKHIVEALKEKNNQIEIFGIARDLKKVDIKGISTYKIDMLYEKELSKLIKKINPDCIFHLAAESSVSYSWENPADTFQNNTNIFINLLESVRKNKINCRILSVGSSEEYGTVESNFDLNEATPLQPKNPYAVARVSQELLSKVYIDGYNLDIVLTRSFNHIGVGQSERFVVSSFAKQVAMLKLTNSNFEITTGDLDIIRDFIDVRDVVNAYVKLIERGKKGEVYNICRGEGVLLKNILDELIQIAEINPKIKIGSKLIRPNETKVVIGNNQKIKKELNWYPEINLTQSLDNILNYWIKRLT